MRKNKYYTCMYMILFRYRLAYSSVGPISEAQQQKKEQLEGAIYEEPLETAIPLRDNQAYGHVDVKHLNRFVYNYSNHTCTSTVKHVLYNLLGYLSL